MTNTKDPAAAVPVRDPSTGRFAKGNRAGVGRSNPRYDRDLTKEIRRQLAAPGDDGLTNAARIVKAMIGQAANGNTKAAEWLGDRAEGKAIQRLDVDIRQRSLVLASAYGLDPEEVARMAQEIADADATPALDEPEVDRDSASEGGSPGQRISEDVDP